jgi:hypothetical protein
MAGLPEFFLILVVMFAAWQVVRMFARLRSQPHPPQGNRSQGSRRAASPGAQRTQARPMIEAEDLVSCRVCGTYVAVSARHCGRADCPRPR